MVLQMESNYFAVMKPASVKEIKSAIEGLPQQALMELCLRLVKFKKENKELATYMLFDADDEAGYVQGVKQDIDELFTTVNMSAPYFAKKTYRKILRAANRYIKYSQAETTAAEILLHVAAGMFAQRKEIRRSNALQNIYLNLVKKIEKELQSLHEDLQYDYRRQLQEIVSLL